MQGRVTVLLALTSMALLAACATPTVSAGPQEPPASTTPAPQQSYWPGQDALSDAAVVVEGAAVPRWPHAYAGVSLDVPGDVLMVHRVPTAGFDDAIRAVTPGVTVRLVDAAHSARALDGWIERVRSDVAYWRSRGVVVHSSFVEIGTCVTLEVAEPQRDIARLTAFYPGIPLCVRQGEPAVPLTAG
ncbi:hypothetical protein [Micromonospora ureilytica]|uniref:hypothetical protein n=1 Tax=Micromonospora ureilytica TaxID=709868 RepID=UPI002E164BF0|nr:hypothetical protein OHB55_16740 [Micromonospora ureilytica]